MGEPQNNESAARDQPNQGSGEFKNGEMTRKKWLLRNGEDIGYGRAMSQ